MPKHSVLNGRYWKEKSISDWNKQIRYAVGLAVSQSEVLVIIGDPDRDADIDVIDKMVATATNAGSDYLATSNCAPFGSRSVGCWGVLVWSMATEDLEHFTNLALCERYSPTERGAALARVRQSTVGANVGSPIATQPPV